MDSIESLKAIYYAHLKPEPCRISETLGSCLALVDQHSLLPKVLRLCDLSTSATQKSANEIIRRWVERVVELSSAPAGSGDDRNRAAGLVLLAQLVSHASFELMHTNKDKWIAMLINIITRVRYPPAFQLSLTKELKPLNSPAGLPWPSFKNSMHYLPRIGYKTNINIHLCIQPPENRKRSRHWRRLCGLRSPHRQGLRMGPNAP